jgi:anti-anti-sigma factor
MDVLETSPRGRLVISPQEALVAGGPAEFFEQQVQALLKSGRKHLVVHLRGVPHIDSAGVRALIRSHTTSQRLGATFQLTAPTPEVRALLDTVGLVEIFDVQETIEAARKRRLDLSALSLVFAGAVIAAILTWAGEFWPALRDEGTRPPLFHPLVNVGKLAAAGAIGLLVINVQRRLRHDRLHTQTIEHAMVLLCMAGALVMLLVGESIARAFGIAGAASVVRFRTPIEDPKETTVLFLLMGLGMAVGIGALAFAGLGAGFLCLFLVGMDRYAGQRPRTLAVEIEADGRAFPNTHVESVFARNRVLFEAREISQRKGGDAVVRYQVTIEPSVSLEALTDELLRGGKAGLKAVEWEIVKKRE